MSCKTVTYNGHDFSVQKFNMSSIKSKHPICYINGKRLSGKSTLAYDINNHMSNMNNITLYVSPTEFSPNPMNKISDKFIYNSYSTDILDRLIQRQIYCQKFNQGIPKHATLILDECLNGIRPFDDINLKKIIFSGHCYGISLILTQQYPIAFPAGVRDNVDFVFLFHETRNSSMMQKLYNQWAHMFPTFELFSAFLDQLTDDYGCLVIDNTSHSDQLLDQIFWYKVDKPRYLAAVTIGNWWRRILDKRQLCRLRINREIELYPGVGIKYLEAFKDFQKSIPPYPHHHI